tara:strand:- start:1207 stop:2583 length:1377 start_codon:yes stop_codon:yes gene_type:complete
MLNMYVLSNYKIADKLFFRLGIFFLPSAPFFSALFFLTTVIISFTKNKKLFILNDKYNRLFMFAIVGMFIIALVHIFTREPIIFNQRIWDPIDSKEILLTEKISPYSSLIGLSNWIPLFFCFFSFQNYLNSIQERKLIMKIFVAGTVPVLVSGFGQYFFNWYGELSLLNGLIIWFQKEQEHLSGLFSNQNYTGCWLNIVWPFVIAIFLEKTNVFYKKGVSLVFLISIALSSFLTSSRNAIAGLFLTLPIIIGKSFYRLFLYSIILLGIIFILYLSNFFPNNINVIIESCISKSFNLFSQLGNNQLQFEYSNMVDKRITIFSYTIGMILKNPIFGYGASTFPFYYSLKHGVYKGHAHNLIIDLTFNYGLLISILIFIGIFFISFQSFRKLFLLKIRVLSINYFERAWWTSFIILLISQMFDVQYYDLRISIAFWLLLSGLKCMVTEDNENTTYTNSQNF